MNQDRLLIIFNTCGVSKLETIDYYKVALDSIFNQNFKEVDVTIASCLHDQGIREELQRLYPQVDIYCIDEPFPIHASFNHAILETLKHRPNNYFGYTYFEAGAVLTKDTDLGILSGYAKSPDAGIVVGVSPHDNGINLAFGINKNNNDISEIDKLFRRKLYYSFPPDKFTNLHLAIYTRKLFDYYGKLQPDIFKSHGMESSLSCLCGAIKTQWLMIRDVIVEHRKLNSQDSICFNPYQWQDLGNYNWNHPFVCEDIIERLLPGYELGLGYAAAQGIMPHDETKWDENHYALDNRLAPFLKKALFLSEEELPHDSIKSTWMEGKR